MQVSKPIKTDYGSLHGRDATHLDEIQFENGTNRLRLRGELSAALCDEPPDGDWIPFDLLFDGVLVSHVTELDTWESKRDWYHTSSFDEVEHSAWLASMTGKISADHTHFIVATYDDVVEVICREFTLSLEQPRQNKRMESNA